MLNPIRTTKLPNKDLTAAERMTKKDESNRAGRETITPLSSFPTENKRTDENKLLRRNQLIIVLFIGTFTALIAIGAWFLYYLSQNPLQPPQIAGESTDPKPPEEKKSAFQTTPPALPAENSNQQAKPPPPTKNPEQLASDMANAEQKLADYLELKNELDTKSAAEWGQNAYTEMTGFGRDADTLLIQEEYNSAASKYEQAMVIGRGLADRTDQTLARLLEEGRNALTAGNGALAQNKFNLALKIDPSDPSAQQGLKRSQTIDAVFQLMESGEWHENMNALSLARAEYEKALQLDPAANAARQAINRVALLIKEQQFSQLMSQGLTAFHNNDHARARARLLKAKSLKPDSREVSDALKQVDQALRLARIDRLRDAAQKAEQAEDWQAALNSYLAVLDIDQNLQFATRGKERAGHQIRIAKRLDYYLTRPQVLESDQQLQNAVLLLHEAREVEPQSRKLTEGVKELAELVKIAQTPVIITIESDNLTQIAVYKVGKLGRFSQRELKLRPGTYTVVGARDGYQDVRQKIVVKPGQQSLRVTVKCRIKI